MTERFQALLDWLQSVPQIRESDFSMPTPASSDASFRRYFRIENQNAHAEPASFIIMDAPVEHEDCRPFIKISSQLDQIGLNVPRVLAQDLEQGFLLLSDLGNQTYLSVLQDRDEELADRLYRQALASLVQMQVRGREYASELPSYDQTLLLNEMNLFSDWLLDEHLCSSMNKLERAAWKETQSLLMNSALQQPQTYVHRDYHSRNLMVSDSGQPGILDFQDAVHGALSYDAVSLLRDCYIAWPQEQVEEWQRAYFLDLCQHGLLSKDEWNGFRRAMDLMGIQRHLKASGIFARLFHRDGKNGYLDDIPQTVRYMVDVGRNYPEMADLVRFLEERVLPHELLNQPANVA
ncbi:MULTISPECIES: aminoglycoside phosphotransferase family protein [Thiomicrorhabdus]|uniref:Phosphotransferase n=1 Tax=Thiomicrorhabdus heinhorstiae TaxID=2748010 RepID=A0ABS0BTK2_9GAMM|nr:MULTISPECIES: phosphotransferase [Thiomicrorhabdus]MBF6057172.1 phosphotransferase [Thiomicrorhabdus heinhorstiae]